MYQVFLRKINIGRQEAGFAWLLFFSAFFLGAFLSCFDITAHSIFFEHWEQQDFPLVYVFSGILGLLLFGLYTFLHKRLAYKFFYFLNISIITILVVAYTIFYFIQADEVISFIGLVLMFPVNLLAIISFWRYKRKLLLPEQAKRLFPFIDFGFISGIVLVCMGSFFLLRIYDHTVILPLTVLFLLALFFFQIPTNLAHTRGEFLNHRKEQRIPIKASLFILWSTKFTRNLLIFAVISATLGFYLHFGFINLFRIRYTELELFSKYYPIFIATLFAFIWVTDRLLIHKVLYSYDSPYSLVLLPLGILIFFVLTVVGILILRRLDYANTLPFLLLIAMNKMVYEISKSAIQLPSFRTLYKALDLRFLQIIYPRIEGAAVMLGIIFSGLLIALLQKYISGILIFVGVGGVIAGAWLFFAVRLIKRYKGALQDTYRKLRISRADKMHKESYMEKIRQILVGDDPIKVINAMRLSARIEPLSYEKGLQRMLANPQPTIQHYVLKCIEQESLLELLPELRTVQPSSDESEAMLSRLITEFEKREKMLNEGVDLEQMVNSRDVRKRLLAAEIIGSRRDVNYTSALVNLTREFEPDVKIAAVKAMARISSADHSYLLIEFLTSHEYHAYAFEALVQIGDPALDYLERLFINPNTDDKILARVVKIYGKVATPKAVDLLLGKLENQSKRVTMAAIAALHEANFQANSLNVHRILNIVVRTIHILGWNYLIVTSLPSNPAYRELKRAYQQEIKTSYDLLFNLLSLAYNARTIHEIYDLLEYGSIEDISHAIELLDHFVYEDIKPVLFPVIENIPAKERVRRLQYYFPIESMDEEEMISSTLTRDYNLLGIYPRICALKLALIFPEIEVSQELAANLFHPNHLLREVAAMVIYKKDPEKFENILERLDPEIQYEMRETLGILEREDRLLLIDKFDVLRETDKIKEMPEEILIEFAEAFKEMQFTGGQSFDLRSHARDYSLFFLVEGRMQMEGPESLIVEAKPNELYYSNIFINAGIQQIHFMEDSTVLAIDDMAIETLLFDHSEIANCVLSCVEQFKLAG